MKRAQAAGPQLPAASRLGSGLGAYTGPPKEVKKKAPEPSSDSSASESDSDEENKGIGALVTKQKATPKPVRPVVPERRGIKILGGPSYGDALRERENLRKKAHYTKMRLRPDVTPLHRFVLAWDPDCRDTRPPYPPKVAGELGPLRPVPTTFPGGAAQYEKVMQPLFLQELWQQFIKDDHSAPAMVEVTYRAYEDDFLDIDVVVPGALPPGVFFNETDIVTIQGQGDGKPIFAKVQGFRRKFKETSMKLRILNYMDQKGFQAKAKLQLKKHAS
jgi:senataxin